MSAGKRYCHPHSLPALGYFRTKDEYIKQAYEQKKGKLVSIAPKGTLRLIPHPQGFTGKWRMWYGNGTLATEQEYRSGVLDGESTWWNDDGSLFSLAQKEKLGYT